MPQTYDISSCFGGQVRTFIQLCPELGASRTHEALHLLAASMSCSYCLQPLSAASFGLASASLMLASALCLFILYFWNVIFSVKASGIFLLLLELQC